MRSVTNRDWISVKVSFLFMSVGMRPLMAFHVYIFLNFKNVLNQLIEFNNNYELKRTKLFTSYTPILNK